MINKQPHDSDYDTLTLGAQTTFWLQPLWQPGKVDTLQHGFVWPASTEELIHEHCCARFLFPWREPAPKIPEPEPI